MSLDVYLTKPDGAEVFSANITHNMTTMAKAAGIYQHLWRPEEVNINKASELILPLMEGLRALILDPDKFKDHNPVNGWGDYECLVEFVLSYLRACVASPDAIISVSR